MNIGLSDWVPAKTETPVPVHIDRLLLRRRPYRFPDGATAWPAGGGEEYAELAEAIRQAFNRAFYPNRVVPMAGKPRLIAHCIRVWPARKPGAGVEIACGRRGSRGGHIDTGILGPKYSSRPHRQRAGGRGLPHRHPEATRPCSGDWTRALPRLGDWGGRFVATTSCSATSALGSSNPGGPESRSRSAGVQTVHRPATPGRRLALGPRKARVALQGRSPCHGTRTMPCSPSTSPSHPARPP